MNWLWFNIAACIAFFALVMHGAPFLPVLIGIAGAALLNLQKKRKARIA
ncbi:MAG: hypothetical protein J0H49_31375 [Acidobacteria bacterium]|nr:hypothetical protein [Acidobacteriota bacterium]